MVHLGIVVLERWSTSTTTCYIYIMVKFDNYIGPVLFDNTGPITLIH